jgi:hypothetical protein
LSSTVRQGSNGSVSSLRVSSASSRLLTALDMLRDSSGGLEERMDAYIELNIDAYDRAARGGHRPGPVKREIALLL